MSDTRRDRWLEWIESELERWHTYHDHKETMAWTATALYAPGIIVLGRSAMDLASLDAKLVISLFIFFLMCCALVFVNFQFEMRWYAGTVTAALRRITARLIADESFPGEGDVLPPPTANRRGNDREMVWPPFIWQEIARCDVPRSVEAPFETKYPMDPRYRTELPSYAVIVLATIIAIGAAYVTFKLE